MIDASKGFMVNLESLPWKTVRTQSGTGDGLLVHILALGLPDEADRKRAYWELDNAVVVQATLYEAAAITALALVEILPSFDIAFRQRAYTLLFELASGWAPETTLIDAPGIGRVSLVDACTKYILRGVPIYLEDACRGDTGVRHEARDVLIRLAEADPTIRDKLQELIPRCSSEVSSELLDAVREIDEVLAPR